MARKLGEGQYDRVASRGVLSGKSDRASPSPTTRTAALLLHATVPQWRVTNQPKESGRVDVTPEEIDKITKGHGAAEFAMDMEATMATVGASPHWEYHPMGLALTDRESVEVQYELLFEHILPCVVSQSSRAFGYGDNYVIREQNFRMNFDGVESDNYFTVVISVDENHVIGERIYNSGPLVAVLDRCFDEKFRALPGVVDLFAEG